MKVIRLYKSSADANEEKNKRKQDAKERKRQGVISSSLQFEAFDL